MDSRPDDVRRRPDAAPRGDAARPRRSRTASADATAARPRRAGESPRRPAPEATGRPDPTHRAEPADRPDGARRRRPRPPEAAGRHDGDRPDRRPGEPDARRRRRPAPTDTERGPRQRTSGEIHTRTATPESPRPRKRRPPRPAGDDPTATTEARPGGRDAGTRPRKKPAHPRPDRADQAPPRPRKAKPHKNSTTHAGVDEPTRPTALIDPEIPPADPDTDSPAAPPPTPPRGWARLSGFRGGRAAARGLIALLSVTVLLCTGYAWNSINSLDSDITRLGGLALGGPDDGATDILLVGTDSRTDAKGNPLSAEELRWLRSGDDVATNTDTILLIRVPNDGSSATAISIPRDSYVDVPGIGMSKINAAYGTTREGVRRRAVEAGTPEAQAEKEGTQAGRKALIDTVANLTGVQVDHYAEVGLLGFVLLTKAVGGVDVCLKDAVNEPFSGARFRAGRQTLNGPQALSFVRQRHDLPRGDLDRITRQQAYMASLTQKILSAGTLADPSKLAELQNAVSRSVIIDDDWDVLTFAEQLKDLSGGRVKFATIPVLDDHGWSDDGQQSVVTVDPAKVRSFTNSLLDPSRNTGRGEYTVDVNNAGTVDGLGANVSGILTGKGYQAGKVSSTPTDERDSAVYAKAADDAGALLLAKDLGGLPVKVDTSLGDHELRADLTNTYGGVGSVSDVGNASTAPTADAAGTNKAITAGTDGPTCVN
ncbi:LCP family protein [Gordonia sp. VNK1]|uniref:LCP family protein n=1 Tax=Gordonia oleivorans TaxID=3156618 RepID=UPI0032B4A4B3